LLYPIATYSGKRNTTFIILEMILVDICNVMPYSRDKKAALLSPKQLNRCLNLEY